MAPVRMPPGRCGSATGLSGKGSGAIAEPLPHAGDRVRGVEPIRTELVRMARLAVTDPGSLQVPGRVLR